MSRTIKSGRRGKGTRPSRKRDTKFMYKSHLDGRDLIPERYIVELVALKLASYKKVKLEYGFWNEEEWKAYYKFQIRIAYQLTAIYPHEAIVKALKDPNYGFCTLRDKRLDGVISKYNVPTKEINPVDVKKFGQHKPKSGRGKLGDI